MLRENIEFFSSSGVKIYGRIYRENPASKDGCIFCHGLLSGKDGYKITAFTDAIVGAGFTLLTFDFSYVSDSFKNFREISIAGEVDELKSAFRFFKSSGAESIHIMGSSMGAAVSLLFAAGTEFVCKSLTVLAAPVRLNELVPEDARLSGVISGDPEGISYIEGVAVRNRFFKELMETDMFGPTGRITAPVLVIHGGKDGVVDVSNADNLEKNLKSEKKKIIIDDGDHNLTRDIDIRLMKREIIQWLEKHR